MSAPIEKAKLIIAQRFRESISLDILSDEIGLSKFHFLRVFRNETGSTPHEFVSAIRLEHSAHMLKMYPDASITDIAFESGFSSPAVFSRSFRNKYKISPIGYKKSLTKNVALSAVGQPVNIPICFMEKIVLRVEASNLQVDQLNTLISNIVAEEDFSGKIYGVFIDAPMHKKAEESRYYIGVQQSKSKSELSYMIDSGYYTHLDVTGDFHEVIRSIICFKEQRIDTSPYVIDSLVGFETFDVPVSGNQINYFSLKRRIYIKVKRG